MVFDFIELSDNLTVLEVLVNFYNLFLLFFYFEIAKLLVSVVSSRVGGRGRKL